MNVEDGAESTRCQMSEKYAAVGLVVLVLVVAAAVVVVVDFRPAKRQSRMGCWSRLKVSSFFRHQKARENKEKWRE